MLLTPINHQKSFPIKANLSPSFSLYIPNPHNCGGHKCPTLIRRIPLLLFPGLPQTKSPPRLSRPGYGDRYSHLNASWNKFGLIFTIIPFKPTQMVPFPKKCLAALPTASFLLRFPMACLPKPKLYQNP